MNMRESVDNFRRSVERRLSARQRRRLEGLSAAVRYAPYLSEVESLAARYTHGFFYHAPMFSGMLLRWLLQWLVSGEYGLGDAWGAAMGSLPSGRGQRFSRLWDSMGQIDIWPVARSTRIPTLYIQGDSELYVLPDQLRSLAARRPAIHYLGIERSGHIPTRRAWRRMERAMIDFGVTAARRRIPPRPSRRYPLPTGRPHACAWPCSRRASARRALDGRHGPPKPAGLRPHP